MGESSRISCPFAASPGLRATIRSMSAAAVTIHMPADLLSAVDEQQTSRDAFIEQAVRHEVARHEHESLRASLEAPHPESREMAEVGLAEWAQS